MLTCYHVSINAYKRISMLAYYHVLAHSQIRSVAGTGVFPRTYQMHAMQGGLNVLHGRGRGGRPKNVQQMAVNKTIENIENIENKEAWKDVSRRSSYFCAVKAFLPIRPFGGRHRLHRVSSFSHSGQQNILERAAKNRCQKSAVEFTRTEKPLTAKLFPE